MNYIEALEYVHSLNRFGIKPGLERIRALCAAAGNPQEKLKCIHIAGTNGKGSTSTMVARALEAAGKSTGLFTSPYVTDFCERICINGNMVEKQLFAAAVTQLKPVVEQLACAGNQPTEFELITAAAFIAFEQAGCEYCVLEAGLGGRLDSTNIITKPLVSAITSVSLDHMAVLGNTVKEIAREKCGIIKQSVNTVCYPLQNADALDVIRGACAAMKSRLILPDVTKLTNIANSITGTCFSYGGTEYKLSMSGEYQAYNAVTAIEICRALGLDESAIKQGAENARVPARMELISADPIVLLDGGHNEDAGRVIAQSIKNLLNGKRTIAVIGMMADKNIDAYLSFVAPLCAAVVATAVADNPRALSANELEKAVLPYCKNVCSFESAAAAVSFAEEHLDEYDALLVCGSLYLAGEVREQLLN